MTDGKGIHCYYYDPDGNILREAAPDGSTTTYEWDEFHHLLARHSPAGRVEKFEYNAAHGQLSRYTAADGGSGSTAMMSAACSATSPTLPDRRGHSSAMNAACR